MLILSRKIDEEIYIGDDLKISVIDIRGDKVRIGINAPSEIQVHRKEVYESIQRNAIKDEERASIRFNKYLRNESYLDAERVRKEHNYIPTEKEQILLDEGLKGLEKKV